MRNIHWLPLVFAKPTTQACAPTGNRTGDLLLCRTMANQLSHTCQGRRVLYVNKKAKMRRAGLVQLPRQDLTRRQPIYCINSCYILKCNSYLLSLSTTLLNFSIFSRPPSPLWKPLKCDWPKLRCTVSIKFIPGPKDLAQKRMQNRQLFLY